MFTYTASLAGHIHNTAPGSVSATVHGTRHMLPAIGPEPSPLRPLATNTTFSTSGDLIQAMGPHSFSRWLRRLFRVYHTCQNFPFLPLYGAGRRWDLDMWQRLALNFWGRQSSGFSSPSSLASHQELLQQAEEDSYTHSVCLPTHPPMDSWAAFTLGLL